jgi:hypothetical protein
MVVLCGESEGGAWALDRGFRRRVAPSPEAVSHIRRIAAPLGYPTRHPAHARRPYNPSSRLQSRAVFCQTDVRLNVKTMDNGNEPATRQDIAEVRTEMKAMEDRLDNRMKAMEERLIEALRDSRTELLKAFYSFTESNRQRLSQLEANQGALITRIGTLEGRMTELERRVIFPDRPTQ